MKSMSLKSEGSGYVGNDILPDGCYYLRYTRSEVSPEFLFFEGTLRVLRVGADGAINPDGFLRAGGDLYCRWRELPYGRDPKNWEQTLFDRNFRPEMVPLLKTGTIPVFPRVDYKYYLEVIELIEVSADQGEEEGFTARFKVHEYRRNTSWPNPGMRTAIMKRGSRQRPFFSGKVMDEGSGQVIGTITMEWVSSFVRQAQILVDKVAAVNSPCTEDEWKQSFHEAKWDIQVIERDVAADGRPNPNVAWTVSELHSAMLQAKDHFTRMFKSNLPLNSEQVQLNIQSPLGVADPEAFDLLDQIWLYHLMCVETIKDFPRGVMYDTYGADSNNVPREGAAIGCHWKFEPNNRWGEADGELLQNVPPVLRRVAVHEIGHAMGLDHNHQDLGFMNTTDSIADEARVGIQNSRAQVKALQQMVDQEQLNESLGKAFSNLMEAVKMLSSEKSFEKQTFQLEQEPGKEATDIGKQAAQQPALSSLGFLEGFKQQSADLADLVNRTGRRLEEAKTSLKELKHNSPRKFPQNLSFSFHKDDLHRLRFGPDVTVRPGGEFDEAGPFFDKSFERAQSLRMEVTPLLNAVPLGAPVRIQLRLTNISQKKVIRPDLSLSSGMVYGVVTDPAGVRRTFWPLKKCVDVEQTADLEPGASVAASLTLLRGAQGALFPQAGSHTISVNVAWDTKDTSYLLTNATDVYITPPVNDAHRVAALKVLSTPDTLLSLVVGGDHIKEGKIAVGVALQNEVLSPHFAIIDIKTAVSEGDWNRLPRLQSAVLSFSEIERLISLLSERGTLEKIPKSWLVEIESKLQRISARGTVDMETFNFLTERLKDLKKQKPVGVKY